MAKLSNSQIARILYEIAEMLDIIGENRFKGAAYRRAAKAIETMPVTLENVYKKGGSTSKAFEGIPGVGPHIAEKLSQLVLTGKLDYYEKLKKKVPEQVGALMNVPGLGPKKIKRLNEALGIKTLADLKRAAKEHKIAKLAGFGPESEKDILEGIGLVRSDGRIQLAEAEKMVAPIISRLRKVPSAIKVEVAGSIRRRKPTIGDIDIIASSNSPEKLVNAFASLPQVKKVLAKGATKAMVILKSGLQADIRVLKPESWGAGFFYFTGSKNYNIEVRKRAMKKGYKLSEYGLFDRRTGKQVAGKSEKEIFKILKEKYVPPEKREY